MTRRRVVAVAGGLLAVAAVGLALSGWLDHDGGEVPTPRATAGLTPPVDAAGTRREPERRAAVPGTGTSEALDVRLAICCADEREGVAVQVRVFDSRATEHPARSVTTPAEVTLPAVPAGEVLEVAASAPGYLPQRVFVGPSSTVRRVVLEPGARGAQLTWSIRADAGDPNPVSCTLDVYEAESGRDEYKDIPVSSFFLGMRAATTNRAPIQSVGVDGSLDEPGEARFVFGGLPTGGTLVVISRRDRGRYVTWLRLHPGETRQLGVLELSRRRLELRVIDADTKLPIAGARVIPRSGDWTFGSSARTAADGSLVVEDFWGSRALVTKDGYRPTLVSCERGAATAELRRADMATITAPPGSWVGTEVDGIPLCVVADVSGRARVPLSKRRPYVGIVDPRTWRWVRRPATKDGLVLGKCNLRVRVTSGGTGIGWGHVELSNRSRAHYMASIQGGVCEIREVRAGPYKVTVHVGTLIHDNDHRFELDRVILEEGDKRLEVELPAAQLKLEVRRANGDPARYEKVFVYVRGQDPDTRLRHNIGSLGFTDREGRITYGVLPGGLVRVRAGGTNHDVHTSEDWNRIELR